MTTKTGKDRWNDRSKEPKAAAGIPTAIKKEAPKPTWRTLTCFAIVVKTGTDKNAGSDSNVTCRLIGTKNTSRHFALTNSVDHRNKFERGQTDTFFFPEEPKVGDVVDIELNHDETGPNSSWQVEWVEVTDSSTGTTTASKFDQWLDKGKQTIKCKATNIKFTEGEEINHNAPTEQTTAYTTHTRRAAHKTRKTTGASEPRRRLN